MTVESDGSLGEMRTRGRGRDLTVRTRAGDVVDGERGFTPARSQFRGTGLSDLFEHREAVRFLLVLRAHVVICVTFRKSFGGEQGPLTESGDEHAPVAILYGSEKLNPMADISLNRERR